MSTEINDPLAEALAAEAAAAAAPRKANITTIAAFTHTPRDRARRLLKEGGMRRDSAGKYLFVPAVELILASIDPARSVGHQAGGDASALADAAPISTVSDFTRAKQHTEKLKARKAEIEIAKMEGRLIDREAVIGRARDLAAYVRTNLAGIGAAIANDLVGLPDAPAAQHVVDTAIHAALIKLTDADAYFLTAAEH